MENKNEYLFGMHPVKEALEAGKKIEKVMFRQGLDGVQFHSLLKMLQEAGELGIEIVICEMSMGLMGFKKEEFIDYPNLSYAGAATFVADAGESAIQLFI